MTSEDKSTKIISYIIIAAILLTVWYMLDMVLLTFIVTFIFYHAVRVIKKHCDKAMPINVPEVAILALVYVFFAAILVLFVSEGLPVIIGWCKTLARLFTSVNVEAMYQSFDPRLIEFLEYIDISSLIKSVGTWLSAGIASASTNAVNFLFNFFISLILAFVILMERKKIQKVGENMAHSRGALVYDYLMNFGKNFCVTFGKVMKVQITIAIVNSLLSMIFLAILGFPGVGALGLMIFVLGLIPVAGVIVSLVPLSIIAISIGGFIKLIEVIIMICILHAIEAYVLNPKLMSSKTNLPVSFTFIILLVGEHYLGVWGLLIGVPLFIFLMNLLEVDYQVEEPKHRRKKEAANESK